MYEKAHVVLIADQIHSRRHPDAVPAALEALHDVPTALPVERTVGDEIQGLFTHPGSVVAAVLSLTRLGGWRIGVGIGPVEQPLPTSTRAARGPAFVRARSALEAARGAPSSFRVDADTADAARFQTVMWLLMPYVSARSDKMWEAVELMQAGLSQGQIADRLGITQGAVSRRLAGARTVEVDAGTALAVVELTRLQREVT